MSVPKTDAARLERWLNAIKQAAKMTGEKPEILAAIMLRESGAGWGAGYSPKGSHVAWGDGGWAYGLMQIDKRYHSEFIHSLAAQDPVGQLLYAAKVLRDFRRYLKNGPHAWKTPQELEQATIAAYNAGPGGVLKAVVLGKHPDAATTGKDYSQWVLGKAQELLLTVPELKA